MTTGDDGIHGENAVVIQDGSLKITKSYEGIEGKTIELKGGEITLVSSDDGLNATGTDSSDGGNGFPQRQDSASSDVFIKISGGTIVIDAKGDGIDSNGNLYVEGGTTYVNGPVNGGNGSLDYNGEGVITGGVFVAAGSLAMAQGFSDTSKQYSILCDFSSIVSGNSKVTLTDSSGKTILTSTMPKEFQSIVISTKELKNGETYTISAGEQKEEATITSIVTRVGTIGGDMRTGQRPQNSQGMRKREN